MIEALKLQYLLIITLCSVAYVLLFFYVHKVIFNKY